MLRPEMVAQLALAAVAAAADLAGAFVVTTMHKRGRAPLRYCVAAGAGFMLAAAFVRMLPETTQVPHAFLFVLIGYFGVHLFEHTVAPHFHFGEEVHEEALLRPSVGYLALLGLGVLTLIGAAGTSLIAEHHVGYALAISAGVTIYVAASDLIPEVNREGGPALGWTVFAGVLLFALIDFLLAGVGAGY